MIVKHYSDIPSDPYMIVKDYSDIPSDWYLEPVTC